MPEVQWCYGSDARLYNGIHDLETRLAEAESVIERQAKEIEELRVVVLNEVARRLCQYCASGDVPTKQIEGSWRWSHPWLEGERLVGRHICECQDVREMLDAAMKEEPNAR